MAAQDCENRINKRGGRNFRAIFELTLLFSLACVGLAGSRALLAHHSQPEQALHAERIRRQQTHQEQQLEGNSKGSLNLEDEAQAAPQHMQLQAMQNEDNEQQQQRQQQEHMAHLLKRQMTRGEAQHDAFSTVALAKPCRRPWRRELVPRLVPASSWHSSRKSRSGPEQGQGITLVTQLSLERLEMLEMQCAVWPDPLAAAVYVPTVGGLVLSQQDSALNGTSMEEVAGKLQAFHQLMEDQGSCQLHLELTTQDFEEEEAAGLYPFNAARNRAMMLAETEVLLLLDADFLPSPSLAEGVRSRENYGKLVQQLQTGPSVLVVPAFQTVVKGPEGKQLALETATGGKAGIVEQYHRGTIIPSSPHFAKGHGPTNYQQWVSGDEMYPIQNQAGYEPYVLISSHLAPWFDERFLGYGWDKISYFIQLGGLHFKFWGHPTAFAVHISHRKAPTFMATKLNGHIDKLRVLFQEVKHNTLHGVHTPVVANASAMCLEALTSRS